MVKKAFGTYEIAHICHVSPTTVCNWVEKGLLPTFTTGGGHRRVWTEDLVIFLKAHNIPVPEGFERSGAPLVLVVDDEDHVRKVVKRIIERSFPQVELHEAVDGFEAGQKISQLLPTLIILDMKIPGINGLKVCKMMRADPRLEKIKILAITGHNPEESETQLLSAGADAFLAKPFNAQELTEKIMKLLSLKAAKESKQQAERPKI